MVVLITGASSGIGRETALMLAQKGVQLCLTARRMDRLQSLARDIQSLTGKTPLIVQTDVSKQEQVQELIKKTHDHFQKIDVLINNAGLLMMEPFAAMPLENIKNIMDTNFWSLIYTIQAITPIMTTQGGGHIVNVGSGLSRRGLPFMSAYCASKFALAGLTESVRLELARHNITFTSVYPGGVETEMPKNVDRRKLPSNYPDHAKIPVQRAARAVVKAVQRKPLEVYVPWWVKYAAWLSVISPSLADCLIRRHYKNII